MTTNQDSYRIASPYRHRNLVWALVSLACLLVGIGLGWVMVRLLSAQNDHWFMTSFAAAAILILGAIAIQRSHTRPRRRQRETLRQGIDLKHLQRTLINFGYQPPVIEAPGLRTQMVKVSRRNEVPNQAPLVLIEHYDGADVLVRCESIGKDYVLQKNCMVRVDFALSDINRQIVFIPLEGSQETTGYVLLHLIVNE